MKYLLLGAISCCMFFAVATIGYCEALPTPTVLKGGEIISADEMKSIVEHRSALIFDVRNPINYGKGHVSTAISLPYTGQVVKVVGFDHSRESIALSKLPADKTAEVIFYSHGDTGWKSYVAAIIAVESGYKNVMWLREGFSVWKSKGYATETGAGISAN